MLNRSFWTKYISKQTRTIYYYYNTNYIKTPQRVYTSKFLYKTRLGGIIIIIYKRSEDVKIFLNLNYYCERISAKSIYARCCLIKRSNLYCIISVRVLYYLRETWVCIRLYIQSDPRRSEFRVPKTMKKYYTGVLTKVSTVLYRYNIISRSVQLIIRNVIMCRFAYFVLKK